MLLNMLCFLEAHSFSLLEKALFLNYPTIWGSVVLIYFYFQKNLRLLSFKKKVIKKSYKKVCSCQPFWKISLKTIIIKTVWKSTTSPSSCFQWYLYQDHQNEESILRLILWNFSVCERPWLIFWEYLRVITTSNTDLPSIITFSVAFQDMTLRKIFRKPHIARWIVADDSSVKHPIRTRDCRSRSYNGQSHLSTFVSDRETDTARSSETWGKWPTKSIGTFGFDYRQLLLLRYRSKSILIGPKHFEKKK